MTTDKWREEWEAQIPMMPVYEGPVRPWTEANKSGLAYL